MTKLICRGGYIKRHGSSLPIFISYSSNTFEQVLEVNGLTHGWKFTDIAKLDPTDAHIYAILFMSKIDLKI